MTRPYQEMSVLASVLLEESYVLDINARPGVVDFMIDFVLTPDHPAYRNPNPDEQYCYRRGRLHFSGVRRCVWINQGAPPARDASGETDYGNIDSLTWDDVSYTLEGDWGLMELNADRVDVLLE